MSRRGKKKEGGREEVNAFQWPRLGARRRTRGALWGAGALWAYWHNFYMSTARILD